jgi:hypothetical protein
MNDDDKRTDGGAESERAFAQRAREALDAQGVPDDVAARLRQARQAAVASVDARPRWAGITRTLAPAGGLAAGALIALVFLRGGPAALPDMDERELAAAAEMELLDDMEFVAWLIETEDDAG